MPALLPSLFLSFESIIEKRNSLDIKDLSHSAFNPFSSSPSHILDVISFNFHSQMLYAFNFLASV